MSNIPHAIATTGGIVPRSLYALEQSILGWAHERNLIHGSTCRKQLAKTCEEFGELAAGLNKGKYDLIKDGVGDVLVTLIIANGCAGGEYLFSSEESGNTRYTPSTYMLKHEAHMAVLKMLYELNYVVERSDQSLYMWRTERLQDLIKWLQVASNLTDSSLAECLLTAWMEIKDRKGRMVDGVFVKQADLPCQPLTLPELDELVRSPEQETPVPPDHNC